MAQSTTTDCTQFAYEPNVSMQIPIPFDAMIMENKDVSVRLSVTAVSHFFYFCFILFYAHPHHSFSQTFFPVCVCATSVAFIKQFLMFAFQEIQG